MVLGPVFDKYTNTYRICKYGCMVTKFNMIPRGFGDCMAIVEDLHKVSCSENEPETIPCE